MFNALPEDWASDPVLIAGLRVDDDDKHDDPVLLWPDGRVVDTWREEYSYTAKMTRSEYEYLKRFGDPRHGRAKRVLAAEPPVARAGTGPAGARTAG